MTSTQSRGPADGAAPESANRGMAVFFGGLGAFITAETFFIILAITGNYDPLLGSAMFVLLFGAVVSVITATVVAIGSAGAVFCQSHVVKRHGVRLNAATAISGGVAPIICYGLGEILKPEGNAVGMALVTIVIAAVITFSVLEILLRTKVMLPPLASLCPHCGYPVGVSDVCTECGSPLPPLLREKG